MERIVKVCNRVIKEQITVFGEDYRIFDLFPNQTRFEFISPQVAVQLVVTKLLRMLGKVSQGIIYLTRK